MKSETLDKLLASQTEKQAVVLATDLTTGEEGLIYRDHAEGVLAADEDIVSAARRALRRTESEIVSSGRGEVFLHVFTPSRRMILVGAVHISQPLAAMAARTGYEIFVVDPRGAFASEERFPNVTLMEDWPDEALEKLAPDSHTAVVTLTHDPKLDDPALSVALKSDAFYIGALGSRKTHAARLERLRQAGFGPAALDRIHGPVGLAIGAESPAEIAVSILAQVTDVLHKGLKQEAA